jgi:hypothetical protein
MHLRCCSIAARAQIKVAELRVAHQGRLNHRKSSKNEQVTHILVSGGQKTHQENSLIIQQCMSKFQ